MVDQPAWYAWYTAGPSVMCAWGTCVNSVCAECGRINGGFGRAGCPCDVMGPGWGSYWPEGLNKPHPPVKPKGRHADRIRNSARAHKHGERYLAQFGWTP